MRSFFPGEAFDGVRLARYSFGWRVATTLQYVRAERENYA